MAQRRIGRRLRTSSTQLVLELIHAAKDANMRTTPVDIQATTAALTGAVNMADLPPTAFPFFELSPEEADTMFTKKQLLLTTTQGVAVKHEATYSTRVLIMWYTRKIKTSTAKGGSVILAVKNSFISSEINLIHSPFKALHFIDVI
ncbi:hypothetical protein Zmor_007521 [Zophobas morio]|uniref:Uncharacterized protein n=1 Tax=Zophobas morio TaxID=2755281 RepID=A0AA38MPJ1_9CUCU|nr:hypothetical protein Zmor_007521 [Zophobas morio]